MVAAIVSGALSITPALAQTTPQTPDVAPIEDGASSCTVAPSDLKVGERSDAPLLALCGGEGVLIGYADAYEVIGHKGLAAVVVDMTRNGARRVVMVSAQQKGPPLVEDITGQLAMAGGKGPTSSLEGIEVDLTGFATEGAVAVRGRPDEVTRAAPTVRIGLDQQVISVRSRRAVSAAEESKPAIGEAE